MWIKPDFCRKRGPHVFMIAVALLLFAAPLQADEPSNATPQAKPSKSKKTPAATSAKKQRRRLPNHYAKLVTDEQRESIYEIQRRYREKIEPLRKQIEQLIAERNAEIRQVLTPEQQRKLDELLAGSRRSRGRAKARRKAEKKTPPSANAANRDNKNAAP